MAGELRTDFVNSRNRALYVNGLLQEQITFRQQDRVRQEELMGIAYQSDHTVTAQEVQRVLAAMPQYAEFDLLVAPFEEYLVAQVRVEFFFELERAVSSGLKPVIAAKTTVTDCTPFIGGEKNQPAQKVVVEVPIPMVLEQSAKPGFWTAEQGRLLQGRMISASGQEGRTVVWVRRYAGETPDQVLNLVNEIAPGSRLGAVC